MLLNFLLLLFSFGFVTPNVGINSAKLDSSSFIIYYHTDWCGYCKLMDRTIFRDSLLKIDTTKVYISINCDSKDTITVKGKVHSYKSFCSNLGINAYPAFDIFSYKGRRIKRSLGAMSKSEFEGFTHVK